MKIILTGSQGSGKGAASQMLSKLLNLEHISPGELIREGAKNKEPDALKAEEYTKKGELAPDELVNNIVLKKIQKHQDGFILDGFPRTLEQAKWLDSKIKIDFVIEIIISEKESIRRISSRWECPKCGKIHNTMTSPILKPRVKGKCNDCGADLIQREDDTPEKVRIRLKSFHEKTEKVLEYYKKKGIFHKIEGEAPIEIVVEKIRKVIGK